MIVFGTDGWRGIIAKDFTFDNLRIVAVATGRYILDEVGADNNPAVVVGYDTRFLSKEFAQEVAQILASMGIVVHLTDTYSSTPQVSFHTKQKGANLGIVITASHNPPMYNGFKVKAYYGGPADPSIIARLEEFVRKVEARPPSVKFKDIDSYTETRQIRLFNAKESYLRYIKKKINIKVIADAGFKILYDPMYGSGINTLKDLLPEIEEIHEIHNPSFGDIDHPEPIQECLHDLIDKIKHGKYDIGIATDGDADRVGAVDHEGTFVDSHKIFMILLKYLYEVKKKRGVVAKTISLTSMVEMYCKEKGIEVIETPVGFKYIAELMKNDKVLIGGEESGGLSTILHIPERDGIFNALLLMEVMAVRKRSLKQLCQELDEEFGIHRYKRRDVKVSAQRKKEIMAACEKNPSDIGKYKVIKTDKRDGYKFYIDNGWLLIRSSGTEPLIRFYAEADSFSIVNELLDEGIKMK
jgi:phosphomannomutase